jgi:DNA-binding protein H-NS
MALGYRQLAVPGCIIQNSRLNPIAPTIGLNGNNLWPKRMWLESECGPAPMKKIDLEEMSIDDLWALHEKVSRILSVRIASEKHELEKRLAYLNRGRDAITQGIELVAGNAEGKPRRKYPRVLPKYRNPSEPHETWSGRGKQPRWLVAAIRTGRKIDDFRIGAAGASRARRQSK